MEDQVLALPHHTPTTIAATTTLRRAMELMLSQNVGALLVVDEAGKLLGIFSERDLLKKVAGVHDDYELPVHRFMTPQPETVGLTDTLNLVLNKMDGGGYRHLPVIDDGKPVNLLSVRDLLRHITKLCNH